MPTVTLSFLLSSLAMGHPLIDGTYQRGLQVEANPQELLLTFELVLSPKTLVDELKKNDPNVTIPPDDAKQQELYLQQMQPILARQFLVTINDAPQPLEFVGSKIDRSHHEKLVWQYRVATWPKANEWSIEVKDTAFADAPTPPRLAFKARQLRVVLSSVPTDLVRVSTGKPVGDEPGRSNTLTAVVAPRVEKPKSESDLESETSTTPGVEVTPSRRSFIWLAVALLALLALWFLRGR